MGQTLTADTSDIADSDGLTVVSYSYQWISTDGSSDSNLADATGSTYTPVTANTGKSIKLKVTFTDDAGNAESLTSAATDVVQAPLTGDFTQVPASHDGESALILELTFSESPLLSFRTLKFHAFTVDGGAVRQAKRLVRGSNLGWQITVAPVSEADVTVTLPATTDCADAGAVCMAEGRKLSAPVTATIPGLEQNAPASGVPTISGTEQVGETLTTDTSGISDANGLTNPQFAYQWIRNNGSSDADITDANGRSYTLTDDDVDKSVKVQVRFNDDDGNSETLTSAATGTVAAPAESYQAGTVQPDTDQRVSKPGFVELSGGSFHMCGIDGDGSMHCWGEGNRGQLDAADGEFTTLASGSAHTCAIETDGSISCWDWDTFSQATPPSGTFASIASPSRHSCAIATDDTIACWGLTVSSRIDAPSSTYRALSAGSAHTCTIATDDTITCWGDNMDGQADAPTGTIQSVSLGDDHSCAVTADAEVVCWGSNEYGKSGVAEGTFRSVSAGANRTCAIGTDQSIACWGFNRCGQSNPPGGTYQSVRIGEFHTCAVTTDDTVVCWGNERGRRTETPEGTYQSIVTDGDHTIAIAADGTLVAWPDLPEGMSWVD